MNTLARRYDRELCPARGPNCTRRYSVDAVAAVLARRSREVDSNTPGAIAARVFALFAERIPRMGPTETLRSIVQEMRLTPEIVRRMYLEWVTPIDLPVTPPRPKEEPAHALEGGDTIEDWQKKLEAQWDAVEQTNGRRLKKA